MFNFIKIKVGISIFFIFSCTSIDYLIQKPVKIDPKTADSYLLVKINDDEIIKYNTFPRIYLYIYVDGKLMSKSDKVLKQVNLYEKKYFGSLSEEIKIPSGYRRVKVVYKTYRNNSLIDFSFKDRVEFLKNRRVEISFNKEFNLRLE